MFFNRNNNFSKNFIFTKINKKIYLEMFFKNNHIFFNNIIKEFIETWIFFYYIKKKLSSKT